MSEKENLELAACQQFLELFNRKNECNFQISEQIDRPDFIAEDYGAGRRIGIEIAHLYLDGDEAKLLLRKTEGLSPFHSISELIDRLNHLLNQKARKVEKYTHIEDVHLVVRVASHIWEKKDFEMNRAEIVLPDSRYSDVWLIFKIGPDDLMKLS